VILGEDGSAILRRMDTGDERELDLTNIAGEIERERKAGEA
jgi:hypothetical protein